MKPRYYDGCRELLHYFYLLSDRSYFSFEWCVVFLPKIICRTTLISMQEAVYFLLFIMSEENIRSGSLADRLWSYSHLMRYIFFLLVAFPFFRFSVRTELDACCRLVWNEKTRFLIKKILL